MTHHISIIRRSLLALAISLAGPGVIAQAQTPAGGTVKLIVGYPAGVPVDAAARVFGQVFGRELGQIGRAHV